MHALLATRFLDRLRKDHAEHLSLVVDHRHAEEGVLFEEVAQVLKGCPDVNLERRRDHLPGDLRRRLREQEVVHAQDAAQAARGVGDVDVLDVVAGVGVAVGLQVVEDFADRLVLVVVEVFGDHQAPGGVRRVHQELARLFGIFRFEVGDDAVRVFFVELAEEVDDMVTVELFEYRRRPLRFELLDQVGRLGVGDVLDDVGGVRRAEQLQQLGLDVDREARDAQRRIHGAHGVEVGQQRITVSAFHQLLQLFPGSVASGFTHGQVLGMGMGCGGWRERSWRPAGRSETIASG